jgi:hypothetical protein
MTKIEHIEDGFSGILSNGEEFFVELLLGIVEIFLYSTFLGAILIKKILLVSSF